MQASSNLTAWNIFLPRMSWRPSLLADTPTDSESAGAATLVVVPDDFFDLANRQTLHQLPFNGSVTRSAQVPVANVVQAFRAQYRFAEFS